MRVPGGALGVMRSAEVPRWSSTTPVPPTDYSALGPPRHPHLVFPYEPDINDRLAIWQGDVASLEVDAMTNTTSENMDESNAIADSIYAAAGSGLKDEIFRDNKECRTGDVCVTSGHQLAARHIIHTVSPKYTAKYHSAAENSLHNCYRNILYAAQELGGRTVALCIVNTPKKNFPPDLAAHVALRTIRRYFERHSVPRLVILCGSGTELAPFIALAPLYFPRSHHEAQAARWRLGAPGGPAGEPAPPERRVRIIHNPHASRGSADDEASLTEDDSTSEAAAAFARMTASPDTQRLLGTQSLNPPLHDVMLRRLEHQERYDRLLRRARSEDLSEISGIGCLYQSGVDRLGRPVVVFIGKWFPINDIDLDKALLYLIQLLDPIVRGDYVIAYFHTLAAGGNHPPFSWLKEVYTILPYKYKKNLKAFYIVHPTFWTKMMTWWFTTFMAPAIKAKVHNLPGVEYLYSVMARDQLDVPAFVTEYDMTINGLHYFQPDASSTT